MKYLYSITCMINNKIYVGTTKNFKTRVYDHRKTLRANRHANKYLQEDFNRYGGENFKYDIIDIFENEYEADRQEKFYIGVVGLNFKNGFYNIYEGQRKMHFTYSDKWKKKKSEFIKKRGNDYLRKKIVDSESVIYESVKEYAQKNNLNYSTIKCQLQRGTNTDFKYL